MYISVNDAATKFNISKRRVQLLCEQGRIAGANMVSGVWLIPEASSKPQDMRRKNTNITQSAHQSDDSNVLNLDTFCKALSISKATAKNWIRLGKITPDAGELAFSQEYVNKVIEDIKSPENTKLKSRRNKKNVTGTAVYKDYVHTPENRRLVEDLLACGIIQSEIDLKILLANLAVQLYFQRCGIQYSSSNVLQDFLSQENSDDFHILIEDLLGGHSITSFDLERLRLVLTQRILYVSGEDSLGFVYISLRDMGQRKSVGAYYTPEKIVDELIDHLYASDKQIRQKSICDPCCGTGNFLLGLGGKGIDYSHLYGQDIDPTSVYLARINIVLANPQLSAVEIKSKIIIGNTYFEAFPQKFDVILGNPPWGSDFSDDDAQTCRSLYKSAVGKSIESYDLFVEKSLSMLCDDGTLAFVLPEAILSVASHDTIRKILISSCSFKFVSYLGNVFSGVQCPAIILGVSVGNTKSVVGCRVTTATEQFTIERDRNFADGTLPLNISDEEDLCISTIAGIENAVYLKNNAKFALGIVTGNNKEFVSSQMHAGYETVLKGSDIYRYGMAQSKNYISFTPESFQQVAPIEMYRAEEKLLYRFISEVPVFTYDNRQTLSLNSCNIVIPEIEGVQMKYVLAILNSSVAAYYISKKFCSIKLLRSHIEQMPIPFVSNDIQCGIIKKVDRIMNSSESISGLYEELDNDIMELYGLSKEDQNTIARALSGKNRLLKE